ncbi:MAG: ABC transporter substrate-binding protein [Leptothrix sp. (in: b-proteobacteria)]
MRSLSPVSLNLSSLSRRGAVIGTLAAGLAFGLAAPAQAAGGTLKVGTTVWIGYGPFYVADALDLYKKYNLKVKLQSFTDPALIPPAIASGAVDGAMITYDQVIGEDAKGRTLKVVMPIDYSAGGDAIVADPSVTKVTDFKGKSVAFNPLSPSDFLLAYALAKNGMTDKDIKPVNMTPEAIPAAMASGKVPVGVTYEPSVSQILSQGGGKKFKVVYSSKDAPGLIADVLVFEDKTIKAKPADIKALIQGYLDGLAYMKSKPDEAAKLIGKAMGISAAEVKDQLSGVYNIPPAEMAKAYVKGTDTTSYYASGAVIGKILKDKGQITAIPSTESTIDDQFVKAVAK